VLNKLFGVPSINFGDENIYFGATSILFGGALNGCQKKSCLLRWTEKIASHCRLGPSEDRTP
jgi:hypothetical protein